MAITSSPGAAGEISPPTFTPSQSQSRPQPQPLAVPASAAAAGGGAPVSSSSANAAGSAARTPAAQPPTAAAKSAVAVAPPKPSDGGIINKTLFKCRKCKVLFWTTHDAAHHEQTCREPQWYNCSVCSVLRFRTREERSVHERTCPGLKPLRIDDLPLAERLAKKKCDTADSPASDAAAVVKNALPAAGQSADKTESQERKQSVVTISREVKPKSESVARDSGDDSSSVEVIEVKPPPKKAPVVQVDQTKGVKSSLVAKSGDHPKDLKSGSRKGTTPSTCPKAKDAQKKDTEWTTVWTCDICKTCQFDRFDAAVEHEKHCQGKKMAPQDTSLPSAKNVPDIVRKAAAIASSPIKMKPTEVVLFSPILKDGADSSNYSQISKYHRLILKSLQLLYLPSTSGGGSVSFRCKLCSCPLYPDDDGAGTKPNPWTLKMIVETLPSMVLTHITSGCNAVPPTEGTQLPMTKGSGKMPFDEFLSGFFSENGIVERPDGRGVVVLSDDEFRKMPECEGSKRGIELTGSKKRRGRPAGAKATVAKRQKSVKATDIAKRMSFKSQHKEIKYGNMGCKIYNEDSGARFLLAPLDGIPFLTSFSRKASEKLCKSAKFLLQQIELFCNESTGQSVGIRCRNCIADKECCFMRLSFVGNLSRDVLLIATEHVVSCKFMKAKDVKIIQEVLSGLDANGLATYCHWIAKLYCLRDSKDDIKSTRVFWGDSPTLPAGYSDPAGIDVCSVLGTMPSLEEEIPQSKGIDEKGRKKEFTNPPSPDCDPKSTGESHEPTPNPTTNESSEV
ncbi:hypothetical protein ACHAWF_017012, partial [Thalassiosira exigua]